MLPPETNTKPNTSFQLLKWLLSFVLLVSLGVLGWLYFLPMPAYRLIPRHAFAIVNLALKPHLNPYMEHEWWQTMSKIPECKQVADYKFWLDSVSKEVPELFLLLQNERVWVSFHAVAQGQSAWLAVTSSPVAERNQPHEWAVALLKYKIAPAYHLRCEVRRYDDFLIYELYDLSGKLIVGLTFVKDFLLCSSSGVLLDDALRTAQGKQADAGKWLKPVLQPVLPSVWQFYGNTYHVAPTWKGVFGFHVYPDSSGIAFTGNALFPQRLQIDTAVSSVWNHIVSENPVIADWLIKNKRLLLKFNRVSAHTHDANGKTTVRFSATANTTDNVFKVKNTTHLVETAYSPFVPYYARQKALWWSLQDAEDIYYIFDEKGYIKQKIWLDDLASRQVITHFYEDKPLFFWTSGNLLYALNEACKIQNGYPVSLSAVTARIAFISPVFDDGLLVTDIAGNMIGYDWQGKPLKNWAAINFQQKLVAPPIVLAISGKTLLVGVGEQALIKAFQPDGKFAQGFPLYFETKLLPGMFLEKGLNLSTSYLHLLSESGEHFVISLEGRLVSRTRLSYDVTTDFFLLADKQQQEIAFIASHKGKELTLYNLSHEKLATMLLPYTSSPKIDFFDFGQTHSVISLTYPEQKKTFLFYLNGEPITEQPLWASQPPVFIRYDSQHRAYTVLKAINKTVTLVEVYEK